MVVRDAFCWEASSLVILYQNIRFEYYCEQTCALFERCVPSRLHCRLFTRRVLGLRRCIDTPCVSPVNSPLIPLRSHSRKQNINVYAKSEGLFSNALCYAME